MTKLLEGAFVIGCSLVGFCLGSPEGTGIKNTMQCSIQLIAMANENIGVHLAQAQTAVLRNIVIR